MSRAVWKVRLQADLPSPQVHQLPFGARPLHVDVDPRPRPHLIAVWFEVEREVEQVGHRFWVIGTDQPIPEGAQYVGTVVSPPFAWHVYCGATRGEG